jgi:hypothetical protein
VRSPAPEPAAAPCPPRWREAQAAAGGLWAGALLDAVEIDDWGKFKFVLVRVRDRAGRQKMLVRGRNYASEGTLLEALHRQVGEGRLSEAWVQARAWQRRLGAVNGPLRALLICAVTRASPPSPHPHARTRLRPAPTCAPARPPAAPPCPWGAQMIAAAAAHGVPAEALETVGGGVMAWRRDRARHLLIHGALPAPSAPTGPNGPLAAGDVLKLAGTLVRGALPITYQVTLEGPGTAA